MPYPPVKAGDITWKGVDGLDITIDNDKYTSDFDDPMASLTISELVIGDNGNYSVTVNHEAGLRSLVFELVIKCKCLEYMHGYSKGTVGGSCYLVCTIYWSSVKARLSTEVHLPL